MSSDEQLRVESLVVGLGRPAREADAPLNTPIVPASSFHAGGEMGYAREDAPTMHAFEDALGVLEGGTAVAFASGMAAANAVMDTVAPGGLVVAPSAVYMGVGVRLRELEAAGRIRLAIVDLDDEAEVIAALPGADLLWLESPTNPLMQVVNLPNVIAAATQHGVRVVVDSTFATPLGQQPLAHGATFVMHSVTKSIAGHSDLIMGAIVCAQPEDADVMRARRVFMGGVPSAFDCFLALRGMRTLALRVERGEENARELVRRLAAHPKVSRVRYPGFGTMAAFELGGDAEFADRVCESVTVWTYATSLGGVESLIERRRRWESESASVPVDLIRMSCGIEHVDDLWDDLARALG